MNFKNWFVTEEEKDDSVKHILDSHGLVFFFSKGDDYFGTGEDGRIVFARIKNPDDETPDGWEDEASFTACNLEKLIKGQPCQSVVDRDSIKSIKVMDQSDVVAKLRKLDCKDNMDSGVQIIKFGVLARNHDRDAAPNFTRTDEE